MPQVRRILYPIVQGPVLDQTQTPETVMESKWHQPWSEPVRFKILPALAVVLAASSGNWFNPLPLANADPSNIAAMWWTPWREPVRTLPSLITAAQNAYWGVNYVESSVLAPTAWFNPFTDPVRVPARLTTGAQRADWGVTNVDSSIIAPTAWYAPWRDPVRVPLRLTTGAQKADWLVEADPFPETATESRWHQPWSEPVRLKPDLGAARQVAHTGVYDIEIEVIGPTPWFAPWRDPVRVPLRLAPALNQFEPDNPWGMTQPESVTEDRWHQPWSEPKRFKPALTYGAQKADFLVEAAPFPETVMESKWHQPWSEPKRYPKDLGAPRQAFYFGNTDDTADLLSPTAWFAPWRDPVRLKPGLLVDDQTFVGFQVIEPLFPNYLLTVRNQIVRDIIPAGSDGDSGHSVRNQTTRYVKIVGPAWTSPHEYPPEEDA